jgi:hypothetical protein
MGYGTEKAVTGAKKPTLGEPSTAPSAICLYQAPLRRKTSPNLVRCSDPNNGGAPDPPARPNYATAWPEK